MLPYERFPAWGLCHELTLAVYSATDSWPASERYGLISQIRRAAASAPCNIAEGTAKRGKAELRRYLDITLGSLSEVAYLLRLARDLGFMPREEWESLEAVRAQAGKATWLLYRSAIR